jgi:hypothetical protein
VKVGDELCIFLHCCAAHRSSGISETHALAKYTVLPRPSQQKRRETRFLDHVTKQHAEASQSAADDLGALGRPAAEVAQSLLHCALVNDKGTRMGDVASDTRPERVSSREPTRFVLLRDNIQNMHLSISFGSRAAQYAPKSG